MASQKIPFKSQALSRDLAVRLKNRGVSVVSEDVDSDGFPIIKCDDGTGDSVWIHIQTDYQRQEDAGQVDGLGLPQRTYAPHVVEVLKEETGALYTATIDALATIVIAEASKLGTKLSVRAGAGVAAALTWTAADMAAGDVVATYESSDTNPLTEQM